MFKKFYASNWNDTFIFIWESGKHCCFHFFCSFALSLSFFHSFSHSAVCSSFIHSSVHTFMHTDVWMRSWYIGFQWIATNWMRMNDARLTQNDAMNKIHYNNNKCHSSSSWHFFCCSMNNTSLVWFESISLCFV